MPRILAFIMLCGISYDSAGYYLAQIVKLRCIVENMRELAGNEGEYYSREQQHNKPRPKPSILRFKTDDFAKLPRRGDGKEFIFDGALFDIADLRAEGDTINVICYRDDAETDLYDKVSGNETRRSNSHKSRADKSVPTSFLVKISVEYVQPDAFDFFYFTIAKPLLFNIKSIGLNSPFLETPTPPPRA